MELKITKEKVLEAASKCSTAKATLQTLFPECFEEDINLYRKEGIGVVELFIPDGHSGNSMIALRDNTQFYLSNKFNWELINNGSFKTLKPSLK